MIQFPVKNPNEFVLVYKEKTGKQLNDATTLTLVKCLEFGNEGYRQGFSDGVAAAEFTQRENAKQETGGSGL